jgi:hypothetical protein
MTQKKHSDNPVTGNRAKLLLPAVFSFILMFLLQLFYGFQYLDDYLVVLIFILFLNDQTMKYKHPEKISSEVNDQRMRKVMTILFLILFSVPVLLDHYNISQEIQLFLYKMGFILWAQVFLVESLERYYNDLIKQELKIISKIILSSPYAFFDR